MTHAPEYEGLVINSPRLRRLRGGSVQDAVKCAARHADAEGGIGRTDIRAAGKALIPDFRNAEAASILVERAAMTFGTGVGGDKSITVSGELTGQAELKITVEAGSSLLRSSNRRMPRGNCWPNPRQRSWLPRPFIAGRAAPARPSSGAPFPAVERDE